MELLETGPRLPLLDAQEHGHHSHPLLVQVLSSPPPPSLPLPDAPLTLLCSLSYFAAVSGTSMYDSWVYSVYNFALGLPIIFYGIFDRDIPAEFALKYPMVCPAPPSPLLLLTFPLLARSTGQASRTST
jgi:hypothetical protein